MNSKGYSNKVICGYCHNISNMEIIGKIEDGESTSDEEVSDFGTVYCVLKCPACYKVNIVSYDWYLGIEFNDRIKYTFLHPVNKDAPLGLPSKILSTYQAAEKVKPIDVNAYAILMRRLLELICIDRKAKGKNLAAMLKDLAAKNEIPDKLVMVANGLKNFGNIGAHAGSGELSKGEIPIVSALITAILEYIYSAPHLASIAESKLEAIRAK